MSAAKTVMARFVAIAEARLIDKTKNHQRYKREQRKFVKDTINKEFLQKFGKDEDSLRAWQGLCSAIGISRVDKLKSVSECRKALKGVHVNIVDLVDAANAKTTICETFARKKLLAEYTAETDKIYPLKAAKENPLLHQFLVKLACK
ncbi:hypothetical protein BD626DRAFT_495051 [Schizophyllum amplum]|uniref:Uncharacterized protein n=1 Tax=Schizophyllum amplum TaxID=97359 RepID=A0A550CFU4_9AGAR|nr:hypothetical protein BD626DRAFT_495051 [Auriculariopsis ampla]